MIAMANIDLLDDEYAVPKPIIKRPHLPEAPDAQPGWAPGATIDTNYGRSARSHYRIEPVKQFLPDLDFFGQRVIANAGSEASENGRFEDGGKVVGVERLACHVSVSMKCRGR